MRVLGIDPGYAIVGWSIVDFESQSKFSLVDCGVITTEAGSEIDTRLVEITADLCELLDEFKPELAGVETLLFQKNIKTAIAVSESRGAIVLTIAQHGIPIQPVNPMQVKNGMTGYGKADKKQIQESVKMLFNLEEIIKPDDAADAVAIAITAYDYFRGGINRS